MRRHLVLAAAIAGLLVVSGCGSDSGTKRTVTAVVTVSSGADASGSAVASSGDVSGSAASSAPSGSSSPSPTPSSSVAAAPPPIVSVDPLKVDCGAIISAADVQKAFGAQIPNDRLKITVAQVNADVGQTGRVRCLYGLSADKKSGAFSLVLTQYTDAAAAQKQVQVTIANETDNGAQITQTTVGGYPATVAVRDGGLIIMSYDSWTLALAATAASDPTLLATGLPQLADAALARVLKG